jgi:putative redox protein
MKIRIKHEEGYRFIAQAGEHKFYIDQPKDKGGSDLGMNPLEVFLSSLGSCVAVYTKRYCQDAKIDYAGLSVDIDAELSQDRPFRFSDIKVKIALGKDVDNRKDALLNFVRNCPIHNTVSGHPNISIEV